jgi:hypothetical protein
MIRRLPIGTKRAAMMLRALLLLGYALLLVGCETFAAHGPVINSGSYDWTDQVRDTRLPAAGPGIGDHARRQ